MHLDTTHVQLLVSFSLSLESLLSCIISGAYLMHLKTSCYGHKCTDSVKVQNCDACFYGLYSTCMNP